MARIGMDVEVVTQHGSMLKQIGDNDIPALLGRVDHLIGEIQGNWWGQDAQHFHSCWTGKDRPALQSIAHQIATFGQQAILNAQQQSQASTGAGGI